MIRPFHLRDLPLVLRLGEQGVSLHSESALTNEVHPLRGALHNLFIGGDFPTYVWKAERGEGAGFIQVYLKEESRRGHILYLSSTTGTPATSPAKETDTNSHVNANVWLPLLDQAVVEVGQRGIHSLVAEVSETGPELPILRQAGFAVYTRQDIWVLQEPVVTEDVPSSVVLQTHRSVDDWDIQLLYANIVPRLVQLVEPLPPLDTGRAWVIREGNELTACVHLTKGEVGSWLRLFVHPNAESHAEEIVSALLKVGPRHTRPVFCAVPRYQSWLQGSLQRCGFTFWGSQAVMVKHTVHPLRRTLPELTAVLESQGITTSSPIVQRYYQPVNRGAVNDRRLILRLLQKSS